MKLYLLRNTSYSDLSLQFPSFDQPAKTCVFSGDVFYGDERHKTAYAKYVTVLREVDSNDIVGSLYAGNARDGQRLVGSFDPQAVYTLKNKSGKTIYVSFGNGNYAILPNQEFKARGVLYAQLYNFVELVKGEDKEYKKESLFEFKEPIENEKKEIVRDEYMTVEEYADHFGVSAQTALMRNKEGYIVDVLFEDGKFFFKRSTNSTDELFQKNKLDKLHSNGYITAREFSSIADVDIQTVTDRCAKGMVEGAYMDACKEWIVPAGSDPTAVQDADLPELASRIGIAIQNAHKQAKKGKIPGMYEIGRDLKYKKLLFKRDLFEQYVADYLATKNNSKPKVTKEEFKTIRNELVKSREKVRATEISEKDYGEEVEFDPKLPTKLISLNEYARRKGWSFQFAKKRFDDGKLPSAFREGDTIAVRVQAEEDKREVWGHMTLAEYAEKNNVNLATAKYRAKRGQIDGVYKDGNKFFVKIFKPRGEKRILEKWVTLVEYTQLQGICIKEAQIRYHNGKYEGKKVNGKIYFPIYKIVKEDKPEEEGNV